MEGTSEMLQSMNIVLWNSSGLDQNYISVILWQAKIWTVHTVNYIDKHKPSPDNISTQTVAEDFMSYMDIAC